MCVIYACWSKTPTKEELEMGSDSNSDGAGICWIKNFNTEKAKVQWLKGLKSNPEAVLEAIEKNKITYPFGIHYRTASIGGRCDELTHPFPITDELEDTTTGSTRRVLMHNGHINDWKTWFLPIMFTTPGEIPMGPWSDSRALAAAVNCKGEGVLDFILGGSRVMILDSIASVGCNKTDPESYFRLYGPWIKKEGYHQSTETSKRSAVIGCDRWRGTRGPYRHEPVEKPKELVVSHSENTWTVDELEGFVSEIRKEQDEARILLGC